MQNGAVALIDALGFRGIWSRHDPQDVLTSLKQLKDVMESRIAKQFATQPAFQCSVAFLSDTIAISMSFDNPQGKTESTAMSVVYLCDIISWILEHSLRSNIPFAYRGAVAVGEYELSPHFLIGEAIDEAAEAHELAQGALIWLTPKARDMVADLLRDRPSNTHLVRFPVPLKGGDTFNTFTVSPLEQAGGVEDANALTRNLLRTFVGAKIDVAIKLQNTSRHLEACYEWRGFKAPSGLLTP
jgi:class 3 adenylate cyclase